MDEAFVALRLIHFASVMIVFGGGAFRLYAVEAADEHVLAVLDARLTRLLLGSAIVALLSALLYVPLMGSRMAGSAWAALDWSTDSVVLTDTSFGRVWCGHMLLAVIVLVACAIPQVRRGYHVALAALLLASLGWVGHAAAGAGQLALGHEINESVHLLAGGIWLGGLVPMGWLAARARRSGQQAWYILLRDALQQFSRMGYGAVAFLALTGLINAALLVGSIDALVGTVYGLVLLVKVLLFAMLVTIAGVNRVILVPRIRRETTPSSGTTALLWTVGTEQAIGLAILLVVSVLGTLPPGIDVGGHFGMHHQ